MLLKGGQNALCFADYEKLIQYDNALNNVTEVNKNTGKQIR